jgi:outer membrane lipoprotein carrier protein
LWWVSWALAAPATPGAGAASPEVRSLVDRMQAFYEKTQDFSAKFTQRYTYASFNRTQTSSGEVLFRKPGFMRWDYQAPAPKTFVLAQDRVLALDPAAMTLTKTTLGANQLSSSVTFLFGKGKLLDEFSIRLVPCSKCNGRLLELTPLRPDPRFQRILLEVDPKSAQVLVSTVVDPDESENRIEFLELKPNVGIAEARFKLEVPPGTQIVDLSK